MRRLSAMILALMLAAALAFPASAGAESLSSPDGYYARFRGEGLSINVYNWGEYISDGSDDTMDINAEFTALTGIRVYYSTYATNEELYSKLRGGASSYDVIIPSDYMIARMIGENMLEPLDFANIPNYRYIGEDYLSPVYDPEDVYSVPYTWGITGIIYNTEMVFEDEVNSWDILWDEKYMGQILMFSNPRDAFGIAQKRLGYSMNTTDPAELNACFEDLKAQKPLVQAYVMDEIFDKMLGGEAALAPYYAGDAVTMIGENPSLAFAAPEEGVNKFADAMCIPVGSRQKQAAEMYINFMCEPEVAAANADYIGYATPNTAALELLDAEVTEDPVAYPPEEVMDKAEAFGTLPRDASLLMDTLWTDLLSSDENYSRMLVPILLFSALLLSLGINVYRTVTKRKRQRLYF